MGLVTEPGLLISAESLAAAPGCIVFDCRFSLTDRDAGRRDYEAGHIPGARYADLESDLSAPAHPSGHGGRHPLPDRAWLGERLRSWGVDNDSPIVCYDQNSGAVAGRFWWLVRWLGHADVRLLDGGLDAWLAAGYETATQEPSPARGDFAVRAPLTKLSEPDDLDAAGRNLLDARDAVRFRGESEPFDRIAGHIPGAISAPLGGNLEGGRFKSPGALEARFRELGVDRARETVCYCGSGVTATHDILALLLAGHPEPSLYAGSWSDWISDPERPIATGQ
jgi:thiosulfate/3-mercaptopyruvate sulfurtransferase